MSDNVQPLIDYISTEAEKYFLVNGSYPSINIVAHSMGGLIVQRALDKQSYIQCSITNADGSKTQFPDNSKLRRHAGTPNVGSFMADDDVTSHFLFPDKWCH